MMQSVRRVRTLLVLAMMAGLSGCAGMAESMYAGMEQAQGTTYYNEFTDTRAVRCGQGGTLKITEGVRNNQGWVHFTNQSSGQARVELTFTDGGNYVFGLRPGQRSQTYSRYASIEWDVDIRC